MRLSYVALALIAAVSPARADDPAPAASAPATPAAADPAPSTQAPVTSFLTLVDVPPPPPPSLRLEALRVVTENWENSWRYPEPGALLGIQGGLWFMGDGFYRPRTARSAALHAGSIGATLLGQILLESGSPVAGVGALLTGATLDAAAADVDSAAERARPRRR